MFFSRIQFNLNNMLRHNPLFCCVTYLFSFFIQKNKGKEKTQIQLQFCIIMCARNPTFTATNMKKQTDCFHNTTTNGDLLDFISYKHMCVCKRG